MGVPRVVPLFLLCVLFIPSAACEYAQPRSSSVARDRTHFYSLHNLLPAAGAATTIIYNPPVYIGAGHRDHMGKDIEE